VRATVAEVRALLHRPNADAFTHLMLASEMVDELLGSSGLSTERLRLIEMNMAAHLYSQGDPQVVRESYGPASYQYAVATAGEGWCSTPWGQLAEMLDTTGTLKNTGKERAFIWVI
jgi:hypothetical protein